MSKCGAEKKKNKLLCENKGKEQYGGRCGIHKNYDNKTVKTPEVKKPEVKTPEVKTPEVKKPEVKKPEVKRSYRFNPDKYLLESIPIMNKNVADLIHEYVDDDTKYEMGDKKLLKKNSDSQITLLLPGEKYIFYFFSKKVAPYYLWPDGERNYIKIVELSDRIHNFVFGKRKKYAKDIFDNSRDIYIFFLSNDFNSTKNVVITTTFSNTSYGLRIIMEFKLNNKSDKIQLKYELPENILTIEKSLYDKLVSFVKFELKVLGVSNIVFNEILDTNNPILVGFSRASSPRASSPRASSPRASSPRASSPRASSPRASSPRVVSPRTEHIDESDEELV
jgi:hypothetical protein